MGTDLILKKVADKSGIVEVDLGRAYNFEIEFENIKDHGDLGRYTDTAINKLMANLATYIGYSPRDKEDLENIVYDIKDLINEFTEDCEKIGRLSVVLTLEEEGFTTEKVF